MYVALVLKRLSAPKMMLLLMVNVPPVGNAPVTVVSSVPVYVDVVVVIPLKTAASVVPPAVMRTSPRPLIDRPSACAAVIVSVFPEATVIDVF